MNKPTNAAWGEATYSLHRSPRTWPQLEIADLIKNVQKLSSSSAGLDGWSGTELSADDFLPTHGTGSVLSSYMVSSAPA